MASTLALLQAVNSEASFVQKIGQDLLLPIAKVCTSSSALAVARLFTLDKPSDPFASGARNTKERLKKAIGLTQAFPHTRNIARSRLTGRTPQSWPLSVVRIKNVWLMMPKSVKPWKLGDTIAAKDWDSMKTWAPTSKHLNGTLSSIKWQ